jgi:hypothetical protein
MHEVTHITYGSGAVEIVLDSSSLTEVKASDFRFGDYSNLVTSCFTQKELDRISEGEPAKLIFSFVTSDDIQDINVKEQCEYIIADAEKEGRELLQGIYIDIDAAKSVGDESLDQFETALNDVDLQVYLPLYLVSENRAYYFLSHYMGDCELMADASPEAEVLTINTHTFDNGIVLYQEVEKADSSDYDGIFHIKSQYLFMGAIAVLVFLWIFMDRIRKKTS